MKYIWQDYTPETMEYIEEWLDADAVRMTGLDDGWRDFYEYWKNDAGCTLGSNFWCKTISDSKQPFAIIAFGLLEDAVTIMELLGFRRAAFSHCQV